MNKNYFYIQVFCQADRLPGLHFEKSLTVGEAKTPRYLISQFTIHFLIVL